MVRNLNGGIRARAWRASSPPSRDPTNWSCPPTRSTQSWQMYMAATAAARAPAGRPAVRHPQVPRTPPPRKRRAGCYVLVGLRDYEAPNHRLCDLRGLLMDEADRSTTRLAWTPPRWNDALPRTTQPWGGGRGRGSGLSSARSLLQRCTRRRGGLRRTLAECRARSRRTHKQRTLKSLREKG
jgi:hypothetical protein